MGFHNSIKRISARINVRFLPNSLFIINIKAGQKLVFGFGLFPVTKPFKLDKFKGKIVLARIHVTFKEGVLDPQGKTVHHALNDLGYDEVLDVSIGKYMEIKLDSASEEEAEIRVREMCEQLLANTVVESFRFTLVPAG